MLVSSLIEYSKVNLLLEGDSLIPATWILIGTESESVPPSCRLQKRLIHKD